MCRFKNFKICNSVKMCSLPSIVNLFMHYDWAYYSSMFTFIYITAGLLFIGTLLEGSKKLKGNSIFRAKEILQRGLFMLFWHIYRFYISNQYYFCFFHAKAVFLNTFALVNLGVYIFAYSWPLFPRVPYSFMWFVPNETIISSQGCL